MRDVAVIDRAVAKAQADVIRRHHLLGESVVVWHDGRIIELRPGDPMPGGAASDGRWPASDGAVGLGE
jgi:hypothetical protein